MEKLEVSLLNRISEWKRHFSSESVTEENLEELESHLKEDLGELIDKGLNEDEAWSVATHRIGPPESLDHEFSKVNSNFSKNRNVVIFLWGAMGFYLLQSVFLLLSGKLLKISKGQAMPIKNLNFDITILAISIFILTLLAIVIWKGREILDWFDSNLIKRSFGFSFGILIVGSLLMVSNFEFFSYIINQHLFSNVPRRSLFFLIFVFYYSLIAATIFFTMRLCDNENLSLEAYKANINWPFALMLGISGQILIQNRLSFQNEFIPVILSLPVYGFIGWIISDSRKWKLTFTMALLPATLLWLLGTVINFSAAHIFLVFYLSIMFSLFIGSRIGKWQTAKRQVMYSRIN